MGSASLRTAAERLERATTQTLLLMTVAYFVCWTPYAALCLYVMIEGVPATPILHAIAILAAKSSVLWNPLLYIANNDDVREKKNFAH